MDIYTFDQFALDPGERRLVYSNQAVVLAPKALDTLIVLVKNAGKLLKKEVLHRSLWPDTFVGDVTLARNISDVRAALARYSEEKYIETVPKHGYRFAGAVTVTESRLMIAVLPFTAAGDDTSIQIIGEGLAEDIIHTLSRVRGLLVAAAGSSFRFGPTFSDLKKVASDLRTDLILKGSIRRIGSEFRVTAQLIETERFTIRWSEQYDRMSADLIQLQDLIAKAILSELAPRLAETRIPATQLHHSGRTEAWHSLWEGRLYQHRFTVDDLAHAERCFERAISLDPDYALPYLGIAENQHIRANLAHVRPSEVLPKASSAIARALLLEGKSGEVYAAAGVNEVFWRYNWRQAEIHFRSALALSPSSASVHHLYALWWLRPQRRFTEAIVENQLALDLDPLSSFLRVVQAYLFYLAGDDAEAMSLCRAALNFDDKNFLGYRMYGHILQKQGQMAEAHKAYARAVELPGSSPVELAYLAISCALTGDTGHAALIRDQLRAAGTERYRSATIMALLELTYGQRNEANRWLKKAIDDRDPNLFTLATDHSWSKFRGEDECETALRTIGLFAPDG